MSSLKIARQSYQRARQSTLAAFAKSVIARTTGVDEYRDLQAQVQPLAGLLDDYQNKLSVARNRGRAEILAKNLAQTALIKQLNMVATALEELAQDQEQLIVSAGFTVQQETSFRYNTKLPTPIITRATSTGKRGEVRIQVDDQVPAYAVATHAIEYSLDRESGWINSTYHSHRNFVADGLPHAQQLWLRLKSLGHGNSKSDWSEPVLVAVL